MEVLVTPLAVAFKDRLYIPAGVPVMRLPPQFAPQPLPPPPQPAKNPAKRKVAAKSANGRAGTLTREVCRRHDTIFMAARSIKASSSAAVCPQGFGAGGRVGPDGPAKEAAVVETLTVKGEASTPLTATELGEVEQAVPVGWVPWKAQLNATFPLKPVGASCK